MKGDYSDLLDRIKSPPLWWDEAGVPRWELFLTDWLNNPYADEAALMHIECQKCAKIFQVAASCGLLGRTRGKKPLSERIKARELHYGDPPFAGCCAGGESMNSVPRTVLQYWKKMDGGWVRDESLEVDITPDWALELF